MDYLLQDMPSLTAPRPFTIYNSKPLIHIITQPKIMYLWHLTVRPFIGVVHKFYLSVHSFAKAQSIIRSSFVVSMDLFLLES